MRVAQKLYKGGKLITQAGELFDCTRNTMVLGFAGKEVLLSSNVYATLRADYPTGHIVLCSTAGEIYDDMVADDSLSVTALQFEQTELKAITLNIKDYQNSYEAGKALFSELSDVELSYVLLISDGGLVNGSQLVRGIEDVNQNRIPVTGGLAGDGDKFNFTLVGLNQPPAQGNIIAVGFYGEHLKIGHSSFGGWDIFGPEKKVTRSDANCLYEIDGKNALDIYKQYLGKYANELPGSALLFPLYVRTQNSDTSVVRTILSIDNLKQSMVFAGDIPEGSYIRFMKANFDKLIDAAAFAAVNAVTQFQPFEVGKPKFALLISCVGRKLILGKRIDEEVETIKEIFGPETMLSGFYSYGEISPLNPAAQCQLHNQTMTITTFNESIA
ncbi:FIST signal transduction protein [Mucilaginibacter psychrotolerans]|uniref:Histidine kinase n=1 Tax=Mucilaginibacter psychrotolerans TaxID=1524096 RepID=A0A4Y8S7X4_9SPHI|nr:FIST N-terminal domain-containing protein [Mucilaginibacter psychrotolerans]TFF34731.1 histidine kinase [Mucilaginibacter psychrotolerans]